MKDRAASKRILIVDDEENVAFFLRASLQELHRGYQVELATSGHDALLRLTAYPADLVITDLKMPGMDGLELMDRVRARYPHTRLILMTAYGSPTVETAAYRLGACRYINKPFSIDDFAAGVALALAETQLSGRDVLSLGDREFDAIAQCLADLQFEVGAQCVLLADVSGQMVASVGEMAEVELVPLVSLIGGSFATSFEMRRFLGDTQALTLNYHEGDRYDVYSSNVNEELFVVLIFDKRSQRSRVGMVWLYARRALVQLQEVMSHAARGVGNGLLDADFGSVLSDSLDQLLAGTEAQGQASETAAAGAREARLPAKPAASPAVGPGCAEKPAAAPSTPAAPTAAAPGRAEEPDRVEKRPAAPATRPATGPAAAGRHPSLQELTARLEQKAAAVSSVPEERAEQPTEETFSLQQALDMGLLDPSWIDGSGNKEH